MVLILTDRHSPRLSYIATVLFDHWYGVGQSIQTPANAPSEWKGPVINLSQEEIPFPNALQLGDHTLLWRKGVSSWLPSFDFSREPSDYKDKVPKGFDLFDWLFFQLSRYEEYLPFTPDTHGRYPAASSWAATKEVLQLPMVDRWSDWLIQQLQQQNPTFPFPRSSYTFVPTYDLDLPWAYRHKSMLLQPLRFLNRLLTAPSRAVEQIGVHLHLTTDPFDTYAFLEEIYPPEKSVFFILNAVPGKYDKGGRVGSSAFNTLLLKIAKQGYQMGLHPSYRSNEDPIYLNNEKSGLEDVLETPIKKSRQHYLKLQLPTTYQNLLTAGIQEDWSMAFPDQPGFRAGTCRPFPWYDLEEEAMSSLKLFPPTVMDICLKNYVGQKPEEALDTIKGLIQEVKKHGGHFIPIWHNSSFSNTHGWKGWTALYTQLVQLASQEGTIR